MGPCMSAHQEGGCFCRGAEAIGANRQPCSSWTASLEDRGSRLGDRGSEPSMVREEELFPNVLLNRSLFNFNLIAKDNIETLSYDITSSTAELQYNIQMGKRRFC